jgi:hypothetical protein
MYTRVEIAKHAEKLRRSPRTLRRWILRGFDPNNPESVGKFLAEAERKKILPDNAGWFRMNENIGKIDVRLIFQLPSRGSRIVALM